MRRVLVVVALMLAALAVSGAPAQAQAAGCELPGVTGLFAIAQGSTGPAVAAEMGWTGTSRALLRARTDIRRTGPWERFDLVCVQAPNVYAFRSRANGRYVSAELSWTGNNYGLLRARATAIGAWERFRIPNAEQNLVTIQSVANGRYVSAELGWTGSRRALLRARATGVGPWELFHLDY